MSHTTVKVPWFTPPFPPLPSKHGSETAGRLARLTIFRDFLRTEGIRQLFVAHHLDDQIELSLLRLRNGADVLGLSGMSTTSRLPRSLEGAVFEENGQECRVIRPLLEVRKASLFTLQAHTFSLLTSIRTAGTPDCDLSPLRGEIHDRPNKLRSIAYATE